MNLTDYFEPFLDDIVNLNPHRIGTLNDRVESITTFLGGHPVFGEYFIDIIPTGSFAHRTIIKPVGTKEYDADVMLAMREHPTWTPAAYTLELRRAFNTSSTYKGMAHIRSRCVYVDYANEFHVDVVPYVVDRCSITNNKGGIGPAGVWQLSYPDAFTAWLEGKYRITNDHLPDALRLIKYLRDSKLNFSIKSVILTILVGECVDPLRLSSDPDHYADVATVFVHVLEDLAAYLALRPTMQAIIDPAGSGQDFRQRWDQSGYANFSKWIAHYAIKARAALDAFNAGDHDLSVLLWQGIFGPGFKAPSTLTKAASLVASAGDSAGEEHLFATLGIPERLTESVRLVGRVRGIGVRKAYDLPRRGDIVGKNRTIDFWIESCSVPEPYEVIWKVKNHGEESRTAQCPRGKLERNIGRSKAEPTRYVGSHYVEVYIVKNGVCVARDRQPVLITPRA